MSIVLNGDSGITTPMYNGSITSNAVTPSVNMKSRIINGAMVIDQRNAGASGTAAGGVYTVDRWAYYGTQSSKLTWQQNAGSVTPPTGFTNYLGVTSSSSYSVSSSDEFQLYQPIEGFNTADLGFGTAGASTVTLSFWVRSSLTGTFGGALRNAAQNRSYPFSYTISSANTWEQKSVTIVGDTTGTWVGATNGNGMVVIFNLGAGSSKSTTANAWAAGNYIAPTGATSVVGTNGATFYITGVQLEKGSTATSFDYRPYGTELQLCQRYYEDYDGGFYLPIVAGNGIGSSTFKVTKRASPSITYTNGGSAPSAVSATTSAVSFTIYGSSLVQMNTWTASAEL